ncbi:hypothetical protein FDP41_008969 [Naegleria fowleri]|uniref:RING-type domain-containing protein n=1 Tax=Naegleria fowleri TaxID=5763 RepID=A0A6A5BFD5_NAEFO|nr:uncharacterized protein FDP41_008969 [Naegleria fowleri]KAF0972720.1 hypothetical protein FDP41_008969 [Naegleria fowleri]
MFLSPSPPEAGAVVDHQLGRQPTSTTTTLGSFHPQESDAIIRKVLRDESKENIYPSAHPNHQRNNPNSKNISTTLLRSSTTIIPTVPRSIPHHTQSMSNLDTSTHQQSHPSNDNDIKTSQGLPRPNTSAAANNPRRAKIIGVKDKIALFDLYAPSLTPSDKVLKTSNEEMISLSTSLHVPSSSYSKFFLKKFPILKQQVDTKNVKGGGFIAPSPRTLESVTDKMLTPTIREEQRIFNQPIVTTVVEPSAAFDILPKSIQAPFAKDGMHTKLHIPQLPLDTLDMLSPDSFGNSLNSVRVNWIKSDDITERSVSLTSRADSVILEKQRPSTSRAASAGASRRYHPVKQSGSKSLPSTSQRKKRSESPPSQIEEEEENEEEYELEEGHFLADSDLSQFEHNVESIFKSSAESESEIYESLRSSYFLNVKDEKNKRKGKDHISIEEHVKITNELIYKLTSSFKEKVKKIEQSVKKEFEKLTKHHSKRINHIEEKRSNSIVKEFIRDINIRKQNQKLKEQMDEMKKKYDEAMELLTEMNSYKQKYENSRREFEKYYNDRPSKRAENTITTIMAENEKMTLKEKQEVMSDFLKHFYNEDGTLNEKAIFDMFVVNKELHENLSRTRDTVSFLRDQLYEKQKTGGANNQKAQIPFFDASLLKSQKEKQVLQGLSQAQFDEPYHPPNPPDPNVVYELRQRNEYLKKCYEVLSQKVILADRVVLRIKTLYEGVEKFTKCTSCKEPTLKPKILYCGHAFCLKCCNSDKIKKLDDATNTFQYHCSECRDVTEELVDNKNLNELVSFTNEIDIEISELEKSIQDALSMTKIDPLKKTSHVSMLSPRPNSDTASDTTIK